MAGLLSSVEELVVSDADSIDTRTDIQQANGFLLAWISTAPNSPHKKLARMLIFRVFSPQSCYANRCADSLIFRRLLAHRLLDSGHFGALRGEKTLRTGAYQNTNLPNGRGNFPESCESLGAWDVRLNLFHGNPG